MTTTAALKNLGLSEADLASISPEAMAARVARVQAAMWRWLPVLGMCAVMALALFAPDVMAQTSGGYDGIDKASDKLSGFLKGVKRILGPLSVLVVTIAFIFAGYQIAFNHKRITEVAPVLIGAIIIGAAAQLAKMFIDEAEFSQ